MYSFAQRIFSLRVTDSFEVAGVIATAESQSGLLWSIHNSPGCYLLGYPAPNVEASE
jgi:hypothetical protein